MMTTAVGTLDGVADLISKGRLDEAQQALEAVPETDENRIELMLLRGYALERGSDREGALAAYEQVLEKEPTHAEAAFRAALVCEQTGNDDRAVELLERCVDRKPAHVNALINLAVLYEEHGALTRAEKCLKDVLADHPNHWRARHFLKSVKSSATMVYDERTQEERERHSAILDMPISDFELSVRSRNCLRQMNIRSVSDLLKTTEAELLSYKNFGETSLNEIKAMLAQKGLRLGQALQPVEPRIFRAPPQTAEADASSQLNRPVAELELSVRSRKALQRLGVTTLGDLCQHTEAELMIIKNFGQTSLIEIKRQLAKYGLEFRSQGAPANQPS